MKSIIGLFAAKRILEGRFGASGFRAIDDLLQTQQPRQESSARTGGSIGGPHHHAEEYEQSCRFPSLNHRSGGRAGLRLISARQCDGAGKQQSRRPDQIEIKPRSVKDA